MQIEGAERQTLEERVLAAARRAWARGRRPSALHRPREGRKGVRSGGDWSLKKVDAGQVSDGRPLAKQTPSGLGPSKAFHSVEVEPARKSDPTTKTKSVLQLLQRVKLLTSLVEPIWQKKKYTEPLAKAN